MKTVKILIIGGAIKTYEVEETITVSDIIAMYEADADISTNGYEVRMDGSLVQNREIPAEGTIIFSKVLKGNMEEADDESYTDGIDTDTEEAIDEPEAEPVIKVEKKKDVFTKAYVQETSIEELKKELLNWAIESKSKNKYIQAQRAALLGKPKNVFFNGQSFEVQVDPTEDGFAISSVVELPVINQKYVLKSLPNETQDQLINRHNDAIND